MNDDRKRIAILIAKIINDINLVKNLSVDSMEFKIIVQKLGYLLQRIGGIDYGFKFGWLSRGPYSRGLQNYYHYVAQYLNATCTNSLNEVEAVAVQRVENLLTDVKNALGSIDHYALELIASLVMLCSDVYPAPDDVVEELARRKNVSSDIAKQLFSIVKKYGICI
ncbi:MAG: hypothetical protein QXT53_03890 [Ignisphaera sp.]